RYGGHRAPLGEPGLPGRPLAPAGLPGAPRGDPLLALPRPSARRPRSTVLGLRLSHALRDRPDAPLLPPLAALPAGRGARAEEPPLPAHLPEQRPRPRSPRAAPAGPPRRHDL